MYRSQLMYRSMFWVTDNICHSVRQEATTLKDLIYGKKHIYTYNLLSWWECREIQWTEYL